MILFIRKREKSKPHENICKHHDYCCVILPEEGKNIVQYNQDKKNLKIPFITYADMESLLEKLHVCHNNPDKSSITKKVSIERVVIHYSSTVHLIPSKTNTIFKKVLTA